MNIHETHEYLYVTYHLEFNDKGEIIELHCHYHEETFAGVTPEGMSKVKGIINWVSASHAETVEARMYDRLFTVPNPMADKEKDFTEFLNPDSLKTIQAKVEPSIKSAQVGQRFQFERQGYFIVDQDATPEHLVFNQIITLKDTWANIEKGFKI